MRNYVFDNCTFDNYVSATVQPLRSSLGSLQLGLINPFLQFL